MTWFFGILIMLVVGVIVVVASGRGGVMAEVYDDRPDSRVQADGPLTARDLRTVRFSTAFRGYRMSEVDTLLDRLSAELKQRETDQAQAGSSTERDARAPEEPAPDERAPDDET